MPIDLTRTVRGLKLQDRGSIDLVHRGLTNAGEKVSLRWSSVTGELYSVRFGQDDPVLEIYGRVETPDGARDVSRRASVDPTGTTLVDAVRDFFV